MKNLSCLLEKQNWDKAKSFGLHYYDEVKNAF